MADKGIATLIYLLIFMHSTILKHNLSIGPRGLDEIANGQSQKVRKLKIIKEVILLQSR